MIESFLLLAAVVETNGLAKMLVFFCIVIDDVTDVNDVNEDTDELIVVHDDEDEDGSVDDERPERAKLEADGLIDAGTG